MSFQRSIFEPMIHDLKIQRETAEVASHFTDTDFIKIAAELDTHESKLSRKQFREDLFNNGYAEIEIP